VGKLHYFLDIEVTCVPNCYILCQSKYIEEILQMVDLTKSKGCSTPMVTTPNLNKYMGTPLPYAHKYRQVVGAL
jgi:hypothetical protein